jgi:hypothetical protein
MERIAEFDFFSLTYDDDGRLRAARDLDRLLEHADAVGATDAILIAHGFRNDIQDATGIYTRFLTTLRTHLSHARLAASLSARRFVVVGVYWPSKPFRESVGGFEGGTRGVGGDSGGGEETMRAQVLAQLEDLKKNDAGTRQRRKIDQAMELVPTLEGNRRAQDRFVKLVLSLLDEAALDPTEGLEAIRAQRGSEVLDRIADGQRGIGDAFGSIFGRVGQFLNLTTWYLMKNRSGVVGATGVADAVRALAARRPSMKRHLVGHSLGGRLMAACAKSLCAPPVVRPDSLTLLEAAFSHYGFSADTGTGTPGFFREVVVEGVVRGPFLSTFSHEDTVVGKVYAVASRLAGDRSRAIGDAEDPFGGIGRNGSQRTSEAVTERLLTPDGTYDFAPGVLTNLDGSGGLIKDHGDVTNEAVTYAFASAVART